MKICCYPGSFDPLTNGHVSIAKNATKLFDRVIILVANNSEKHSLLTVDERVELIKEVFKNDKNIVVMSTDKLVAKKAKELNACCMVRGLRAVSDYEYEYSLNEMNKHIEESIPTIYLMAAPEYSFLSSSAVKELLKYDQDITSLVPKPVSDYLKKKQQ